MFEAFLTLLFTIKINLSIPAANPIQSVGGPPNFSTRLSYLPPARIVS